MNILISGGTGLIGKALGKLLCQKNHNVFILTRDKVKSLKHCPFPHTPIEWKELETSNKQLDKMDAIINLVGAGIADKRWTESYKKVLIKSRVDYTKKLVSFCNKSPQIKHFISTSAIGFYGETDNNNVDENNLKGKGFLSDLCDQWEAPVKQIKDSKTTIFRLGVVLSPTGGALDKMVPPLQMGYGGALGSGKQVISWIDLDDVTNMYLYALESSLEGVFNAVAPNPVSNETLSRLIANRFSKKPFINVPALALKLVVGEMATTLLESQNVSCKKIQESGFKFSFEKAENSIEKNVASLNSFEKKLDFEQWVPLPPTELFPFFAEAKNLEAITPEFLNFKIVSQSTESIAEGTIIKYKLSLNGLPMGWTTKITQWSPPHMFEDNQESGPYKKWLHKHTFEAFAGGTLMKDSVRLQIPFSALGYFMTSWKVLSDVEKIFKHRRDVIYSKYYADNKNLNKVY